MTTRRDAIKVVEGLYTGQAVWAVHQLGGFTCLKEPTSVVALAERMNCDLSTLNATIQLVHRCTDLLQYEDGRYQLAKAYRSYNRFGFHLDKFLGAYGGCMSELQNVLQTPSMGPSLVRRDALANAFSGLTEHVPSFTAQLLRDWEVRNLLDIGCGTGGLLAELAAADGSFMGWGLDSNSAMCQSARQRVRPGRLDKRVRFHVGDVRHLEQCTADFVNDVTTLHARSLMNEFFVDDQSAINVLTQIRGVFPGRLFFIQDYYGKLLNAEIDLDHQHTILQDMAQVVSGQGVPPQDLEGWAKVYDLSGCDLVKAYEGDNEGIAWFIHVVQL